LQLSQENALLSQRTPPFRAEHIGSLLRPKSLLDQRGRFARGEISRDALAAAEDAAIKEALALQERVGLKSRPMANSAAAPITASSIASSAISASTPFAAKTPRAALRPAPSASVAANRSR